MTKLHQRFTEQDRDFIKSNINTMTNAQLALALDRTEGSIGWQIVKMKLTRSGRKRWTKPEIDEIRKLAKDKTHSEIAAIFSVTRGSIKMAFTTYGIKTGRTGHFKKGHISLNKGNKLPPKAITEAMRSTFFKKGHLPHNTKKNGAISTRKGTSGNSYKWIRVALNKWELLHRYNYEKFIGPIPDEMFVTFKDGNSLNCEPANLKLESKQEHMARNTIMRFDPQLRSTIHLLSKFKRKIKAHEEQD